MTIEKFTRKAEALINYAESIKNDNPERAKKLLESQLDEIIKLISGIKKSNMTIND